MVYYSINAKKMGQTAYNRIYVRGRAVVFRHGIILLDRTDQKRTPQNGVHEAEIATAPHRKYSRPIHAFRYWCRDRHAHEPRRTYPRCYASHRMADDRLRSYAVDVARAVRTIHTQVPVLPRGYFEQPAHHRQSNGFRRHSPTARM